MAGGGIRGEGGAAISWAAAIKEGNLFSGLGTRVFYIGTSSALFFVVYEAMKSRLRPAVAVVGTTGPTAAVVVVGKEKRRQQ